MYCNAAAPQEVKDFKLQLGESVKESVDLDGYTHSYAFGDMGRKQPGERYTLPMQCRLCLKGKYSDVCPLG